MLLELVAAPIPLCALHLARQLDITTLIASLLTYLAVGLGEAVDWALRTYNLGVIHEIVSLRCGRSNGPSSRLARGCYPVRFP